MSGQSPRQSGCGRKRRVAPFGRALARPAPSKSVGLAGRPRGGPASAVRDGAARGRRPSTATSSRSAGCARRSSTLRRRHRVVVIGSTCCAGDVGAMDESSRGGHSRSSARAAARSASSATSAAYEPAGRRPDDRPAGPARRYRGIADHAELVEGAWPMRPVTADPGRRSPKGPRLRSGSASATRSSSVSRDDPSRDGRARRSSASGGRTATTRTGSPRPRARRRRDPRAVHDDRARGRRRPGGPRPPGRAAASSTWSGGRSPTSTGSASAGSARLRDDLGSLNERLRDDRLPGRSLRVESELPGILAEVDRRTLVSRSGVMLLTVQFAILAGLLDHPRRRHAHRAAPRGGRPAAVARRGNDPARGDGVRGGAACSRSRPR